jgi:hypothetical protein
MISSAIRENGSPTAPHFALRRRLRNPTPFETQQELAALFPPHKRVPLDRAEQNRRTKDEIWLARGRRRIEENTQRKLRKLREMQTAAKAEWQGFNGHATQEQVDAWNAKYGKIFIPNIGALRPVTIIPFPTPAAPLPDLIKTSAEFVKGFRPPEYLLDGVFQRQFAIRSGANGRG